MKSSLLQDAISYNSVITACAGDQWSLSLELLRSMKEKQLQPTVISYNSVMSACSSLRIGAIEPKQSFIMEFLYRRHVFHISVGHGGQSWHDALQLLSSMQEETIQADVISDSNSWFKKQPVFADISFACWSLMLCIVIVIVVVVVVVFTFGILFGYLPRLWCSDF